MVIITMWLMRYFVISPILDSASLGLTLGMSDFWFSLVVLVVVFITAAGNIINDYFDQKVDKINKPERVIVGKTVKRRVAMFLNHALNILAVGLCLLVCVHTEYWKPLAVPVAVATLLWLYSPFLKKKPLIGNVIVAAMVAMVPLWAGVFEIHMDKRFYADLLGENHALFSTMWKWLLAFSGFAFLLTLAREVVKDLEDIEGDREGGYRTLAIIWGERPSKIFAASLQVLALLAAVVLAWIEFRAHANVRMQLVGLLLFIVLPLLRSTFNTISAHNKETFHKASTTIKLSMLSGVLSSAFLYIIFQEIM